MSTKSLAREPKSKRYQPVQLDLENKNSSHSLTIELIGRNKRVLEIGTSTGYITKILKDRGNQVIGVEIDKEAGEIAKQYCLSMIIGDVEELNLDAHIDLESIDVIVLADVLEHLRWPGGLLRNVKKYLKKDGYLVISLPNIAHGDIILNLMDGNFRYTSMGLLDETHMRFFARKSIKDLFSQYGYEIADIGRVKIPLGNTETKLDLNRFPKELIRLINRLPDSDVYQFVFKAKPIDKFISKPVLDVDFYDIYNSSIKTIKERYEAEIAVLSSQLQQEKTQKENLGKEIAEMRRSVVWQATMIFHNKIVERAFPQCSRRRRYYDLGLKSGRVLVNDGKESFYFGLKNYLRKYNAKKRGRMQPSAEEETLSLAPSDFISLPSLAKARIAVVIHVYYIDLIEEICSYLKNIPFKHVLLISICKEEDRSTILWNVKKLPLVSNIEIKLVENRGRDIAPIVIDFAHDIMNFDYICHIHTKKSLYSGSDRLEWRDYLYDMILGSSERIQAILSVFEMNPSVGVIYPEIFEEVPYWAMTWLSNKAIASSIVNKLGIRFDSDEYIDFPAGSMFWARREAIEPLLNIGLKINDFPTECGQTDGTMQHTIERCFALAGSKKGLKYMVIKDKVKHLFSYTSHRNLHQYLSTPLETKLHAGSLNSGVVSFDIFDTLLTRPFASPDMVFSYLEDRISKELGIRDFRKKRKDAENIARARKHFTNDVKISEIYSIFAEIEKISIENAKDLLELEVNTEASILKPRNAVIKIAKRIKESGKKIIIVSDTYLEKEQVEKILNSNDINFYDEIYISCEIGKRKDRGDLWDHVLENEGESKNRFLHVGDNEQSDIQALVDRRFKHPIHIMRPSALFRQSSLGILFWKIIEPYKGWRENLLYGMISNFFCNKPDAEGLFKVNEPLSNPFAFGYVIFGPIIFNFISWLIRELQKDKLEKIVFISREGYLLSRAYNLFSAHPSLMDLGVKIPPGEYFLSSRRNVLFASLRTTEDITPFLENDFQGSLRDFFLNRLFVSDIDKIEQVLGSSRLNEAVFLPRDYDRIKKYILKVINILIQEAKIERNEFMQYCAQQGIKNPARIGIVDVGYSGSIQKALICLLGHSIKGYYFITTNKALELNNRDFLCKSYFGEFIDPHETDIPLFCHSLLLESILTAPHGQLIRFLQSPSGCVPEFKKKGVSQEKFDIIRQIQDGIIQFIKDMLDSFGSASIAIEFPKDIIQQSYEMIINGELKIGSLESAFFVEDDYCGNGEIPVIKFYKNKR